MNVFIAIIEEAYITIKMTNRNHWIYAYLKLDDKDRHLEMKEDKFDTKSVNPHEVKKMSSFHNEKMSSKSFKTNTELVKAEKIATNDYNPKSILKDIKSLDTHSNLRSTKKYEKEKNDVEKGFEKLFNKVILLIFVD